MKPAKLTHFNDSGRANMVDVGDKPMTARMARARAVITMTVETLTLIQDARMAKGDVLAVAQVAGITAAKRTWELIPMCHPIALTGVDIAFHMQESPPAVVIESTARATGVTGVEMEALTAVTAAALTVYDMCKAVERDMTITEIFLLEKQGGKNGPWQREVI